MSQKLTTPPGPLRIFYPHVNDVWSLNLVYPSTHIPQHHHNKFFRCCIVYVWIVACRRPVFWWFSLNLNQNWNLSFLGLCKVVDHPKSSTYTPGNNFWNNPNLNPLPPPPPPHCGQPRKCTNQLQVQSWSLGPKRSTKLSTLIKICL